MSGHDFTKRSGVPQRIKNIMCLANIENLDEQSNDQNVKKHKPIHMPLIKIAQPEQYSTSTNMIPKNLTEFVDSLYSRDYSMTSEFFQNFCETQTTATSHHFHNLTSLIQTLKTSSASYILPPSMTQAQFCTETLPVDSPVHDTNTDEKENQQETGILFCKESMPIDSPITFQSTHQPDQILYCKETLTKDKQYLTLSPLKYNDGDYDSDDSVKDKDYEPMADDHRSDDTEDELLESNRFKCTRKRTKKLLRSHSLQIITCNKPIQKRRMTLDASFSVSDVTHITPQQVTDISNSLPPKRRKYNTSLRERKLEKHCVKQNNYKIKTGCDSKCRKKCCSIFSTHDRERVHNQYWSMTHAEKRVFIRSHYTVAIPKRKNTSAPIRNPKRTFTLPKTNGTLASVCKVFFLTTLGFKKTNDKILSSCLDDNNDIDKRGKHSKTPKFDREVITEHIESFNPSAPHYRREHAPNRRYLPNEINISFMYKDFIAKHPDIKISYEMYRTHLKAMNVSFARLGNEECELCESYILHARDTDHDARKEVISNCKTCEEWTVHHEKYTKARQLYDSHKSIEQNEHHIYYSSDLEKVIMLPRLETFKAVIFCPRLTAFNQTFAPVGKITKVSKPLATIWHDGIAGRKQEDIMSAYLNFFLRFRDVKSIHIWMDNCTAQNKNWLFFSMLADIVNSNLIVTERIILYYFEPGHTFMSCDQFHHQVELSMKRKKKIYDFADFEDVVAAANKGRVTVKSLQPQDFICYPNNISERRIQTANPRAYLKNMTEVCFIRSSFDLHYKNDFDAKHYITLKFLNDKFLKKPQISIAYRTNPKGIEKERKMNIIKTLSPIIPKHKMIFWINLPILQDDNREHHQKSKRVTK